MEFNHRSKVIVFGGSHHNTLGVVRALGEKELTPYLIVVSDSSSFVTKSKYIDKSWIVKNEDQGIELLLANFGNEIQTPVLICTSDSASSAIDRHLPRLEGKFYMPNAQHTAGRITYFMDKAIQANLAERVGFGTPKSIVCIADECTGIELLFPVIIKPLKSIEGKKTDIQVCDNLNDLLRATGKLGKELIQIQEFVDKELEYQVIGCSLNGGDQIIAPGISRIIRCPSNTNTGYLTILPYGEFDYKFDNVAEALREVGYSGLFSMEFIRDKSGNDYFMEINFRNDGNAYSVTAAGVNLPYLWYLFHTNLNLFYTENLKVENQIYVMPEISDFSLMCHGVVSFKQWWKEFRGVDFFMLYNKEDKKPFYYEILNTLFGSILRKVFKAK
jgi:predicted ATP-grasp superfamily ATP-dependent carboligase